MSMISGVLLVVLLLSLTCGATLTEEEIDKTIFNDDVLLKKRNFLSMLGVTMQKDFDKSKVDIPSTMMELFRMKLSNNEFAGLLSQNDYANTARGYISRVSRDYDARLEDDLKMKFDVMPLRAGERFVSAKLYLSPSSTEMRYGIPNEVLVQVYDVVRRGGAQNASTLQHRMLQVAQRNVKLPVNSSVALDVTVAVRRWITHGSRSERGDRSDRKLVVRITSADVNGPDGSAPLWTPLYFRATGPDRPVLIVYTEDGVSAEDDGGWRSQRSAGAVGVAGCSRVSMYVNFKAIGLDNFIIAPSGFEAYRCVGECVLPANHGVRSNSHSVVQYLYNRVHPDSGVPPLCCAPVSLSSMPVLYVDEEMNAVLKDMEDMAVDGCGCL